MALSLVSYLVSAKGTDEPMRDCEKKKKKNIKLPKIGCV